MTASEIIQTLYSGGGVLLPNGNALTVDAPDRILTPKLIELIRQHKAELLAALAVSRFCPRCGDVLKLQDRKLDAWFCAGGRHWCDGKGQPPAEIETPKPLTLEEVDARQLVADLLAAGCGFVTDDGEHVCVTHTGKVSAALWLRLDQIGPEFKPLAMKAAQECTGKEEPEWVM